MSNLTELSLCKKFHFGLFLKAYLVENCEGQSYLNFYYYFIIPILILFSLILPLAIIIYIGLKFKKGVLFEDIVRKKIGFLLTGYKQTNFYW